jgi:hypothetical protein
MKKIFSHGGGYFVNKTGKTIQQLLDESNANTPANKFNLFTRIVREIGDLSDKPYRVVSFGKIGGYGNENGSWLTDEDLATLDPDEKIYHFEKSEYVRLGDLRVYKAAKRKSAGSDKKAAKADKEEAKLEKMKDALHGFLGERS